MKVRDSGMPAQAFWESLFDIELILDKMEIDQTIHSLVEFGCGYGTFTLPCADRVRGNITAMDIEDEMLEITSARAAARKNIICVKRDFVADGTGIMDHSVDYVMLFNILHHADPIALLDEAYRILRAGGKAGVIHWNYDPQTPRGPSMDIRPRPADMQKWILQAGFQLSGDHSIDLPPYHYGFVARKR